MHRSTEFLHENMTPGCHHALITVKEDGSFTATDEANFNGKTWINENITGQFSKDTVRADFFDAKLSITIQILDTDYENYLISYECFDNMRFALENEIEPVHITKIAILTHKSDEEQDYLKELEDKTIELLPFFDKSRFTAIKQGKEAKCEYQKFEELEAKPKGQ